MKKFNKYLEDVSNKTQLFEMAHIGDIDELSINVYSDHGIPHFHVLKKDNFELKISINDLKIIDYKWQKNNKKISSSELKKLIQWLNSPYIKNKKITNLEIIEISWNTMN